VGKHVISFLHGLTLLPFGDVAIDSQGNAVCAVPEALLHDLGVDSLQGQDGCCHVAHIVETKDTAIFTKIEPLATSL
jgi:hypothetical protein